MLTVSAIKSQRVLLAISSFAAGESKQNDTKLNVTLGL